MSDKTKKFNDIFKDKYVFISFGDREHYFLKCEHVSLSLNFMTFYYTPKKYVSVATIDENVEICLVDDMVKYNLKKFVDNWKSGEKTIFGDMTELLKKYEDIIKAIEIGIL